MKPPPRRRSLRPFLRSMGRELTPPYVVALVILTAGTVAGIVQSLADAGGDRLLPQLMQAGPSLVCVVGLIEAAVRRNHVDGKTRVFIRGVAFPLGFVAMISLVAPLFAYLPLGRSAVLAARAERRGSHYWWPSDMEYTDIVVLPIVLLLITGLTLGAAMLCLYWPLARRSLELEHARAQGAAARRRAQWDALPLLGVSLGVLGWAGAAVTSGRAYDLQLPEALDRLNYLSVDPLAPYIVAYLVSVLAVCLGVLMVLVGLPLRVKTLVRRVRVARELAQQRDALRGNRSGPRRY
ncbi:hypothetical protein JT358_05745 [Micrococcales bacterium 31B]|nr:hypothetical protein [Micrococcales bacterium 31B]